MTSPTGIRCTRCGVIVYVDLLGDGIDEQELTIKIAAHAPRCSTPEDILAASGG